MNLDSLKSTILVFDIETYAEFPDGREISIQTNFEDYIQYAKCKWFGAWSYKYNKGYTLEVSKDFDKIKELISEHNMLVGFNNNEFDFPILVNNGLAHESQKFNQVDCMKVLGSSTFKDKNGFKFAGRGTLMGYKYKNNSLRCMAETMGLDFEKGQIDYKIFAKEFWTAEEEQEIKTYLKSDVLITKQLFDRLWDYWIPFTDLIDYKYVLNLSWIKNTIASLIYKSACFLLNTDPTYAETKSEIEEMGGRVIDPKYEEARNVWYIDFTSLYPHIFCMFNLFSEVQNNDKVWHGNDLFKVKGYYDISYKHKLAGAVEQKLKERIQLKEKNPNDPMVYTLKIWLNGLYGVARSMIFEKVYTPNCGWDCCWLGQQIQEYTEKRLTDFGFETIYGDTDSLQCLATKEDYNKKEYLQECLNTIISEIKNNVPFPVETFNIKIEKYMKYVLYPFSEHAILDEVTGKNKKIKNKLVKEWKGKKKNYLYIHEEAGKNILEIVGLPLIKDNATPLGLKIFNDILREKILNEESAKFSKEYVDGLITEAVKQKEILTLLAVEYKVKPFRTYKKESQIQAQISLNYFNGQEGLIYLIKNNKVGKVGKGTQYCTVEEALENKLTIEDLEIEKTYNELEPFIRRDAVLLTNEI